MAVIRRGNRLNFLVVFVAGLGSWTYGFSVNILGSVLGMPSFFDYFNLDIHSTSGSVGALSGCYFAGGVVGAGVSAWLCDQLGRRWAMFVTCAIGVVGGILQGAAVHIAMVLVGRALSGWAAGAFQVLVPVYQSEVSPPSQRGRMVGAHGVLLASGASVAIWVGLGCSYAANPQARWRVALALSALSPLVLAVLLYWLPESPRWLISRHRNKQALKVLEMLHKTAADPQSHLAREEFVQITQQLELEKKQNISVWDQLKRAPIRRRLALASLVEFTLQSCGVLVTLNYQVVLYSDLGITGALAIALLGIYTTWSATCNFINSLLVDRIGRVRMLTIGLTGAVISLTLFTVMVARYAGTGNRVGCGFGIFFVFLFTTCYAGCLDVTSYVYCSEIFPTNMRTTGMGVAIVAYFAPALVYGQVAPTAFATIGWKYYLIFIIVPTFGLFLIWRYCPETKGLSLEEIAGVFGDEVALDITHMTGEERQHLDEKLDQEIDKLGVEGLAGGEIRREVDEFSPAKGPTGLSEQTVEEMMKGVPHHLELAGWT